MYFIFCIQMTKLTLGNIEKYLLTSSFSLSEALHVSKQRDHKKGQRKQQKFITLPNIFQLNRHINFEIQLKIKQKKLHIKDIPMADLQYKDRSIGSLVQELNNLGNREVLVCESQLIAIQCGQSRQIRRFQTKSSPQRQFLKCKQSDKKYFYNNVLSSLNEGALTQFIGNWQKGYNCTILLQNNHCNLLKLMKILQPNLQGCLIFAMSLNNQNQVSDLLGRNRLTHRQLLQNKKYYEMENNSIMAVLSQCFQLMSENNQLPAFSSFVDIAFKNTITCAQLHITLLPSQIFTHECNPPFSLIKAQILQILNYIKINPNKRYEHISKLITKRLPMTNFLTKILMSDSCNLILNFIDSKSQTEIRDLTGKFEFFDKLSIIGNLLRKADRHVVQIGVRKDTNNHSKAKTHQNRFTLPFSPQQNYQSRTNKIRNQATSPIRIINQKTQKQQDQHSEQNQHEPHQQRQHHQQIKQLQFCRSLQRKTHKLSISLRQESQSNRQQISKNAQKHIYSSPVNDFMNKRTISKYQPHKSQQGLFVGVQEQQQLHLTIKPNMTKDGQNLALTSWSQQVILLKAQHARQISQYHQTIQLLNKKIMVLTKQLNLDQLYRIHERQMMLLQLKIKQLRDDVLALAKQEANEKASKTIIRRLTQQVKAYETTSTAKKLHQGRLAMLQKQHKQTKHKLYTSQKIRTQMSLQLEALTKRLKIRDTQIQKINRDDLQKYQCQELSLTEEQILQDIGRLVKAVKGQQRNSSQFLLRKVSLILADLSRSRDIVLQCNDFLVQLMEILDVKLGKRAPQIVLDCNKFIRSFLIENLSIF